MPLRTFKTGMRGASRAENSAFLQPLRRNFDFISKKHLANVAQI